MYSSLAGAAVINAQLSYPLLAVTSLTSLASLATCLPPPTAQTPESKKQEFRKYLEKSGVIDALTKVLVGLYEEPERPPNAVDYIKRYMGAPTGIDVEAMRAELEQLKMDKATLESTVKELNERLAS